MILNCAACGLEHDVVPGSADPQGNWRCSRCGFTNSASATPPPASVRPGPSLRTRSPGSATDGAEALQILALLAAVILFAVSGYRMIQLRSISGDTVAEAFFQAMGLFSFGMSAVTASGFFKAMSRSRER